MGLTSVITNSTPEAPVSVDALNVITVVVVGCVMLTANMTDGSLVPTVYAVFFAVVPRQLIKDDPSPVIVGSVNEAAVVVPS